MGDRPTKIVAIKIIPNQEKRHCPANYQNIFLLSIIYRMFIQYGLSMSDDRKDADCFRCIWLWIFVSANHEVLLILMWKSQKPKSIQVPPKKQTNKACFSKPVALFSNLNMLFCSTFLPLLPYSEMLKGFDSTTGEKTRLRLQLIIGEVYWVIYWINKTVSCIMSDVWHWDTGGRVFTSSWQPPLLSRQGLMGSHNLPFPL